MTNKLSVIDIIEIKELAREKLGCCRKSNDIIGTQIFSILSLYARVIYYPLGIHAPWGFTRISGSKDDSNLNIPFVAINSSLPLDCRVFASAHELYHIWFDKNPGIISQDLLGEQSQELNEQKANRFASEFLMDEFLLKQEINIYRIKEFTIKNILLLSSIFFVPYKAMVKRLFELSLISSSDKEKLVSESDASIERYRKRYTLPSNNYEEIVAIDNLVELACSAYEKELITFEKLEYLLELCNLKPIDLGYKETTYFPPNEEELITIMEE